MENKIQLQGVYFKTFDMTGKTYIHDQSQHIKVRKAWFHCCKRLIDCFNYYSMDEEQIRVCQVRVGLNHITSEDVTVTNKIFIICEVPWNEVMQYHLSGKRVNWKGSTEWYFKGKLHKESGPAVVTCDGTEKWFRDGMLHREDGGPSVLKADGTRLWFVYGISKGVNTTFVIIN